MSSTSFNDLEVIKESRKIKFPKSFCGKKDATSNSIIYSSRKYPVLSTLWCILNFIIAIKFNIMYTYKLKHKTF